MLVRNYEIRGQTLWLDFVELLGHENPHKTIEELELLWGGPVSLDIRTEWRGSSENNINTLETAT